MTYERALKEIKKRYDKEKDGLVRDGSLEFLIAISTINKMVDSGEMSAESFIEDIRG